MGILQQLGSEHVGKGMIFFVEGEHRAVGGTCMYQLDVIGVENGFGGATYECRESPRTSSRHP